MHITETGLPGLRLLTPQAHRDERGFFLETYRESFFDTLTHGQRFVQDNHARSEDAGVLRGLHFQLPPMTQAKLVWAVQGSIYDVAVDLREGSPTFGRWFGCTLTATSFQRIYVPRGFAHGYMTLEPGTEVMYKVDAYYAPALEQGLPWNDPDIGITWPDMTPILSAKDQRHGTFRDFRTPFSFTPDTEHA